MRTKGPARVRSNDCILAEPVAQLEQNITADRHAYPLRQLFCDPVLAMAGLWLRAQKLEAAV